MPSRTILVDNDGAIVAPNSFSILASAARTTTAIAHFRFKNFFTMYLLMSSSFTLPKTCEDTVNNRLERD